MSDTPQGGWWKASDGKWYPPESHPSYRGAAEEPTEGRTASGPPAQGWWRASDGNWYPPEAAPASAGPIVSEVAPEQPEIDLTEPRHDHDASSAAAGASATIGGGPVMLDPGVATGGEPPTTVEAAPQPASFADMSRRGMFDFEPAEEEPEEPLRPPRRPLFGGGGESAAPEQPADAPAAGAFAPPPFPAAPVAAAAGAIAGAPPGSPPSAEVPAPAPDVAPIETTGAAAPTVPTGPVGPDPAPAEVATGEDDGDAGGGSRKWLLIAGAAVLLVLAGVLGFLVLGGGGEDAEVADPPATTAEPEAEASTTTTTTSTTTTVAPQIPPQVTGVGGATVDLGSDVSARFLALVTHDGPGAVGVELLGSDGAPQQVLVGPGVTGQLLGVFPVNFVEGSTFRSVRFTGDGPWAVTFVLPESAPTWDPAAGELASDGDRVVAVDATSDIRISAVCAECSGPLTITAWPDAATDTPAPLTEVDGVVTVPAGTSALQVTSDAGGAANPAWTLRGE